MMDLFNFDFSQFGKELNKMIDELYEKDEKNKDTETKKCECKYVNDNGNETTEMSVDGDDIDLTTPEGKAKAHKVIDEFEKNGLMGDLLGSDYVADAAKTLHECVDNCRALENKTTVKKEPEKCTCKCTKTDEQCSNNVDSDLYSHTDYVDYMWHDELAESLNELVDLADEYAKNMSKTADDFDSYLYKDQTAEDLYEDDNEYVANAYLEDTVKNWENVDNKDRYRAVRTLADFLDWVDSHIDF
jgi:hypothetical protein